MSNVITYAIGDVHGCAREFEQLLITVTEDAKRHGARAEIWQLGDLIDRGPDLQRVFELISLYDVNTIVGNHEARFIAEHLAGQGCNSRARAQTHEQFSQLSHKAQEHILSVICSESLNFYMYTRDRVLYYLAHSLPKSPALGKDHTAGAITTSTRKDALTGMDKAQIEHWVKKRIDSNIERVVIVHGHMHWCFSDVVEQIESQAGQTVVSLNIDSGCVYGDHLTAIRLDNFETFQITSSFNYDEENLPDVKN